MLRSYIEKKTQKTLSLFLYACFLSAKRKKVYFTKLKYKQTYFFLVYLFFLAMNTGDGDRTWALLFACRQSSIWRWNDKLFSIKICVRLNRCCSSSFISLWRYMVSSRSSSARAFAHLISFRISRCKLAVRSGDWSFFRTRVFVEDFLCVRFVPMDCEEDAMEADGDVCFFEYSYWKRIQLFLHLKIAI